MFRSVKDTSLGSTQAAEGHRGRCLIPRLEACTSWGSTVLRSAVPAHGHRPTPETHLPSLHPSVRPPLVLHCSGGLGTIVTCSLWLTWK